MAWVSIERQLFSYEYDTLPLGHWTSGVFSITAQILPSSLTAINGIHTHLTPHIRWSFIYSLICAPSLGVYYFLSLTLSVHLSVCLLATNIASSFSFLDGIEPFFVHQFSMTKTTKLFFDFWFRPHNAQNLLPKICTKSPITWLVWQTDCRCLHLPGGFRGRPIQWNHTKCCGADPCCHGNEIWARRRDAVAYRLVELSACGSGLWQSLLIVLQLLLSLATFFKSVQFFLISHGWSVIMRMKFKTAILVYVVEMRWLDCVCNRSL